MNPFETLARPILGHYSELVPEDLAFAPAPKLEVGDVALRTFAAAKKLGISPVQFAQTVARNVRFGSEVLAATAAGPYVNFKLERSAFAGPIVAAILEQGDRYGSNGSGSGKKMLIEHTSINPNASPHVGRSRNAMIGDSLVRLFRFEGYDVSVHYYVNDIGRQIGLLVLNVDPESDIGFDEILEAYVEANARADADPDFAAQGYDLLAKMEKGDPETQERFDHVVNLCLEGQLAVLARLGIHYDVFDRESKYLNDSRLDKLVEVLREKEAVFTDEEARLVVDLSKIGHTRDEGRYFVLMRANGSSMYGFRDLAYTMDKMELNPDANLMVLGEDHKLYAEQLRLILAAAGKPSPEPVFYAYILLKEGKMSTREGKVVLLSEFLDEATRRSAEKVAQQCTDLPPEERDDIAAQVAVGAVRFAILRVGPNKNVVFDWESSLSFTGDTGPYVQYSCARINSILRRFEREFGNVPGDVAEDFPIETDSEWVLLAKLATFPGTAAAAASQRNVTPIAQFALDVAQLFTAFYHDCPVLAAGTDAKRVARAHLCAATRQTLANALGILGIEALERM